VGHNEKEVGAEGAAGIKWRRTKMYALDPEWQESDPCYGHHRGRCLGITGSRASPAKELKVKGVGEISAEASGGGR